MNDFSHLVAEAAKETVALDDNILNVIANYCKTLMQHKEKAEQLSAELNAVKKLINDLEQNKIPETVLSTGLSELKLKTGEKVTITKDVSVTVKDMVKLNKFLEDRGDGDLVKTTLEMGKVPPEILTLVLNLLLETFEIIPDVKTGVNTNSLRAYIRRLCGINLKDDEVAEINVADIDDNMLKIYTYYKTKVK